MMAGNIVVAARLALRMNDKYRSALTMMLVSLSVNPIEKIVYPCESSAMSRIATNADYDVMLGRGLLEV